MIRDASWLKKWIEKTFRKNGFTAMDAKEVFLVGAIYDKILAHNYDELDIYVFFMIIREYSRKPIREIGDLIAHRRKDQGEIQKNLVDILGKDILIDDNVNTDTVYYLNTDPIFQKNEVSDGINEILFQMGLKRLDDTHIDGILLCVISIFQDIQIISKGKTDKIGELVYFVSKGKHSLGLKFLVEDKKGNRKINVICEVLRTDAKAVLETGKEPEFLESEKSGNFPGRLIRVANENNQLVISFLDKNRMMSAREKASQEDGKLANIFKTLSNFSEQAKSKQEAET